MNDSPMNVDVIASLTKWCKATIYIEEFDKGTVVTTMVIVSPSDNIVAKVDESIPIVEPHIVEAILLETMNANYEVNSESVDRDSRLVECI